MTDPISLFVLGLSYGLTVCSLTCLPYVAPYLVGTGRGFKSGMLDSLYFLAGKLLIYAAFGGIAAYIGQSLDMGRNSTIIMGLIMVALGISIPLVKRQNCEKKYAVASSKISMLTLGAGSSLVPCPPLAAIFMLAAQRGSVLDGIFYGAFYGLGLLVSPLIIAGGSLAFMSAAIRQQLGTKMKYIEGFAMLVMVSMGLKILFV